MNIVERVLKVESPFEYNLDNQSFTDYVRDYNIRTYGLRILYALFALVCLSIWWALDTEGSRGPVAHFEQVFHFGPDAIKLWLIFSTVEYVRAAFGRRMDTITWFAANIPLVALSSGSIILRFTQPERAPAWVSSLLLIFIVMAIIYITFHSIYSDRLSLKRRSLINSLVSENKQFQEKLDILNQENANLIFEVAGMTPIKKPIGE